MALSTGQTFRALRHRNYRLLWLGQTGHSASLWMDQVARAVLILDLTGSAVMLSLVIATRLAPILVFGLLAGAFADRYDRKRILLITQLISLATHVFLGFAVVLGVVEIWHVFATAAVSGTAMAFNQPVRQSLIPATVPPEDLMNAVALNSAALSFMRIGGGSLAGLLLIPFDTGGVYLVNAGIYVFVILTTVMMRLPPTVARKRGSPGIFSDLKEGIAYVRASPNLGLVTGLALILFIFGFPYQQVFVPLLAKESLDLGDSGVGFLAGATGAGAFAGSLVVAWKSNVSRPGLQLMVNMSVFGAALIGIALTDSVWLTMLLLAVAGAMTVTYMAFTNGILLEYSDPSMHGRVMSMLSLDRGLIPVGALLSGALVSAIGIQPGLFTLGAIVLALSLIVLAVGGRRLAEIRSGSLVRGHAPVPAKPPAPPAPSGSPVGGG
ncbi:MAG: MFS transporter [Tepidiformaceae bacterium]